MGIFLFFKFLYKLVIQQERHKERPVYLQQHEITKISETSDVQKHNDSFINPKN